MYDTQLVSDMQSGVVVGSDEITGTLNYLADGAVVEEFGTPGNFMALKFSGIDPRATSVLVGLEPSEVSPIELVGSETMNGVFFVESTTQKFKVTSTDGSQTNVQEYNLTDMILVEE